MVLDSANQECLNVDRNYIHCHHGQRVVKISTRVRYAVRLMADIAKLGVDSEPVPLREVAYRQRLSKLYLSQLTIPLRNCGLLRSVWGNKGGFILGRPAAQISLLDIVEAVDGPVCVLECLSNPPACPRMKDCECREVWMEINEGIVKTLSARTLADVVERKPNLGMRHETRSKQLVR